MSANTNIEWCDHTFNPWEGCQRVGPGCDHCYAETRNARFSGGQAVNWGPGAPRRRTSASNWNLPLRWNAQADAFMAERGRRQRVFCASLADVFDNAVVREWRDDLAAVILDTPHLDWLVLTKRIGNAAHMLGEMFPHGPADNVWLGATVVNQAEADRDVPKLLAAPAHVRFLSMEPLLGPVSFEGLFANPGNPADGTNALQALDWVIVGGESGPDARPMHPGWARSVRDQCTAAGVPFLFKQWGEWCPRDAPGWNGKSDRMVLRQDNTDYRPTEADLPRVILDTSVPSCALMQRLGKKAAGRLLDGVRHDGFPI